MKIYKQGIEFQIVNDSRWNFYHNWEPHTFEILNKHLKKTDVYLDLGAWIGPTAIFACNKCQTVHAVEPDRVAKREFIRNILLNNLNNIHVYDCAIGDYNGQCLFGPTEEWGDSKSQLGREGSMVQVFTLETFLNNNKIKPNFIKIDVEGSEELIIPSSSCVLNKIRPILYLSIHLDFFKNIVNIEHLIDALRNWKVVDAVTNVELENNFVDFILQHRLRELICFPPGIKSYL